MSERVKRRMEQTRSRILSAALELFSTKGFEETTVAEISDASDIGKGTFFTYFPSKEAVLNQLGDHLLEQMAAKASTVPEAAAPKRLKAFFEPACAWHQRNPRLSRLVHSVFARSVSFAEAEDSNLRQLEQAIARIVEEGQRAGELDRSAKPEDAAGLLVGMYFNSLRRWHLAGADGALSKLVSAGLDLALNGLRRRPR